MTQCTCQQNRLFNHLVADIADVVPGRATVIMSSNAQLPLDTKNGGTLLQVVLQSEIIDVATSADVIAGTTVPFGPIFGGGNVLVISQPRLY